MKKLIIIMAAFSLFYAPVFADGLNTLIEVGKSQAEVAKASKEETRNFENVRKAVEKGSLKAGQSKGSIIKQYGEPVIEYKDSKDGRDTWVYKSASASFFEGVKIYLFFGEDGKLEETRIVDQPKKAGKGWF